MVKCKTRADEYKALFVRLHKYQRKGADNLIDLLTRYKRGSADYMVSYIELVAERSRVSPTSRITTTNADVMLPIVKAMETIDSGAQPKDKDLQEAWTAFLADYRNHKIKL